MAYSLSTRKAKHLLSKLPDGAFEEGFAGSVAATLKKEDLTVADLDEFIRVMRAEKPSDVSDIPDERLLFMLSHLNTFTSCIETDNPFTNGQVAGKLHGMKGILSGRRVL